MAKIYYRLIKEGRWTLDKVPTRWHDDVAKMLEADQHESKQ